MKPRKTTPSPASPILIDALARAAWHEALARITSGLVHDTNNCLASIVSLSEHCLQIPGSHDAFKNELTLINQAGHKAGDILKNFIQLNPYRQPEPTYYDLNALTTESVDLLKRALKRKIELDLQLAPGPLPVFLDGLALKKSIICLVFNLADSIGDTGKITFQTSLPADPVPARVYQGAAPKGPTVCLTLSTPQVPPTQWDDLFEPTLTGDPQADLYRIRFCLLKQFLDKAGGATSIDTAPTATELHLFLPKASLE